MNAYVTFQGQDPQEEFQFYFRQHWIRMVQPTVAMVFQTLGIGVIAYMLYWTQASSELVRGMTTVALLLFFLAIQWQFLLRFYSYFLSVVVVTDQKVHRIKKTPFSIDDHQMISLWALQELKKAQHGPIQNLLGFGTIIMEAQDTQLRIHFVPRISYHYSVLLELLGNVSGQSILQSRPLPAQDW